MQQVTTENDARSRATPLTQSVTHQWPCAAPDAAKRHLKIEAVGDFWKGCVTPKIRLTGKWLEQAGFIPGERVQITAIAPGVLELRTLPPASAHRPV